MKLKWYNFNILYFKNSIKLTMPKIDSEADGNAHWQFMANSGISSDQISGNGISGST